MLRSGRALVACAVLCALAAAPAAAQSPTPTSTPLATARMPAGGVTVCKLILHAAGATRTNPGTPIDAHGFGAGTWEVVPTGTCATYDVVLQSTGDSTDPVWAIVNAVDETDAAVGAAHSEAVTLPQGWLRANPTAVPTACVLDVRFCGRQ